MLLQDVVRVQQYTGWAYFLLVCVFGVWTMNGHRFPSSEQSVVVRVVLVRSLSITIDYTTTAGKTEGNKI